MPRLVRVLIMWLARALQSQGFGSRKGCVLRVRSGAVAVNGVVRDDPDSKLIRWGWN